VGRRPTGWTDFVSRRLEATIIASALVVVAGSVGLILWLGLGVDRSWAALAAILVAIVLVWLASRTRRATAADSADRRADALEAAVRALEKRFGDLAARVDTLDRRVIDTGRVTVRAVSTELDSLGAVVRDLAETVALHEAELRGQAREPEAASPEAAPPPAKADAQEPDAGEPPVPTAKAGEDRPARAKPVRREPVPADVVVRAIAAERVALFLQPVVGLPHRRVQLYQLIGRVSHPGQQAFVEADEVAAIAARHGLLVRLETALVREAYRIARHLRARDRDVPVLVRIGPATAADPGFYQLVTATLAESPDLAAAVMLAIGQSAWADTAGLEAEALEALRDLRVGFVLDDVEDLRLDPGELARTGVRHVRLGAETLLAAADGVVPSDIHPLDVPGLLSRHAVGTIVTGIDAERTLVEVADFNVELAQGVLFSGPRAVRREVLTSDPPAAAAVRVAEPAQAADAAANARITVETLEPKPERASLRSVLRRTRA
jgi:cyclic-di-GMP phosphodiesterase, flagellum assembly factor TipF